MSQIARSPACNTLGNLHVGFSGNHFKRHVKKNTNDWEGLFYSDIYILTCLSNDIVLRRIDKETQVNGCVFRCDTDFSQKQYSIENLIYYSVIRVSFNIQEASLLSLP